MREYVDLDELEASLGQAVALSVLANCGGQRRFVPQRNRVAGSILCREIGQPAAAWLAERHGGGEVEFPSRNARHAERKAALLRAAVLDAGLTQSSRSANDIAEQFGCSPRRVEQVRQELRREAGTTARKRPQLPLFDRR